MSSLLYEAFLATVDRHPAKRAVASIQRGDLHWLTWAQLRSRVETAAAELQAAGVVPGIPVTHAEANSMDWIVRDLAVQSLGAVLVSPKFAGAREIPASVATIATTAGTSGDPVGVMLTAENLASNALAVSEASGGSGDELRLAILPFRHLYARTCDLYTWIVRGSRLVLAESRETLFRDCQLVRPTVLNGVPYFFQKAIDLAESQGVTLRDLLGGDLLRCHSGGAALAATVEAQFAAAGIPLYNGYGLSEASPVVTINAPDAHQRGTVGRALSGVELRIDSSGELLVRGPGVMLGYWQNETATQDVLQEGWLHTGDLGQIDRDGYLTITGRRKELIALATGKKVAPAYVEALLSASPWIEQAAIVGEGRKGLVALIVPNRERLRHEVRRQRLWVWSRRRALSHPKIRRIFRFEIDKALAEAAPEEQVHRFTLLGRPFSTERDEITPKLSLRRTVIEPAFANEIRDAAE